MEADKIKVEIHDLWEEYHELASSNPTKAGNMQRRMKISGQIVELEFELAKLHEQQSELQRKSSRTG